VGGKNKMGKITEALKKAEREREELMSKGKNVVSTNKGENKNLKFEPAVVRKETKVHPSIICYHNISSQISEQYKILRTNILGLNHRKPLKTILITSALAAEGKTVTALNLASTFAQKENSKVLLLEADLRKPKVYSYMGLDIKNGLSEILTKSDSLDSAIYSTELPNLKIIPAGKQLPPNPSELLVSSQMQNTLEELNKRFDHIIIDSPPVIPVTDASILGALSDGVILVVKAGSTNREAVTRAETLLSNARAEVIGFIITTIKDYPHYYIYSHYYT
jgi:protein-tyrosine kinase